MFSSLKLKLQSILKPFQKRSVSICVQSKVKKIQPKRQQSLSKRNCPQQIDITPKKFLQNYNERHHFDQLETISKDAVAVHTATRILDNRNHKWLDFISDIESGGESDKLLLPSSQQLTEIKENQQKNSKSIIKMSQATNNPESSFTARNNIFSQAQVQQYKCQSKDQILVKPQKQNTLINWLQQNKPQYFMIKLTKQSNKKPISAQIKKKRLENYQNLKKQQLKGKHKNLCIICQEPTSNKQSNQLACAHKIHKVCAQIIKWKPKMKCNLCERKSIKDLVIAANKIQRNKSRISIYKSNEKNK